MSKVVFVGDVMQDVSKASVCIGLTKRNYSYSEITVEGQNSKANGLGQEVPKVNSPGLKVGC